LRLQVVVRHLAAVLLLSTPVMSCQADANIYDTEIRVPDTEIGEIAGYWQRSIFVLVITSTSAEKHVIQYFSTVGPYYACFQSCAARHVYQKISRAAVLLLGDMILCTLFSKSTG
jgi:hypothetical protein